MRQNHLGRSFILLVVTQSLSQLGSSLSGFAVGIWIFQQTGQVTPLTMLALASVVPRLLLVNIAGVLADRWNRRAVLVIADTGQALGTLALLLSVLLDSFAVWQLYGVALLQAACATLQGPVVFAITPRLVSARNRTRANTLHQLSGPLAGLIAPAMAGWLYTLVAVPGVLAIDLASYAIAIAALLVVPLPRSEPRPEATGLGRPLWRDALAGFEYLRTQPGLSILLVLLSTVNVIFLSVVVLYPPYLLRRIGDAAVLGIVLSLMQAGTLCGGVVLGIWGGTRRPLHTVVPAIIASGLCLALAGLSRHPIQLSVALFCLYACPPFVNAPLTTLLQTVAPAELHGRVYASMTTLAQLLSPLAYVLVGPLVDRVLEPAVGQAGWRVVAPLVGSAPGAGMALLMVIGGVVVVILATTAYLAPAVRRLTA